MLLDIVLSWIWSIKVGFLCKLIFPLPNQLFTILLVRSRGIFGNDEVVAHGRNELLFFNEFLLDIANKLDWVIVPEIEGSLVWMLKVNCPLEYEFLLDLAECLYLG